MTHKLKSGSVGSKRRESRQEFRTQLKESILEGESMIVIDDTIAVVFDTDDLREAVSSDNGIDYVYFAADITLAYGITIYPYKATLTFDGTYEGVTHTFTDMNSSGYGDTLGVRDISNIVITFKDINLVGRNYYGIPYVPNSSPYNGVSTIYQNVSYSGRQICHNPYGFTRFIDCDITVNDNEAAETSRLEIGGVTRIEKSNNIHSVFWFYGGSTQRPSMTILSGADVTITTSNYFAYEYYPPDFILEANSKLVLTTNTGISYNGSHTINSFLVDTNATFHYTQATASGTASIYLDGSLSVNEGANFYMQTDFSNNNRLIRFTGNQGGLYINNPKSFVLYNRGNTSATAFYFVSTIPITLSGGQINYWDEAETFPNAGTLDDIPEHKWNRPDYERFTLLGTTNNTTTNIAHNDFTADELADLPPLSELQLATAKVFSIGYLPLAVYSTVITRQVTGVTDPYANVRIMLIPSYYIDPQISAANSEGFFSLVPADPMPFSDYVEVFSNIPFLIVSVIEAVREADLLYIKSAPTRISFPIKPIPGFPYTVLPRDAENSESQVVVVDTRMPKDDWTLWINITGPLTTQDGYILSDAIVFAMPNNDVVTVETEFKGIHTGRHADEEDEVIVRWAENRGILTRISATMRSGKPYTTSLGWIVMPYGERPEEGNE